MPIFQPPSPRPPISVIAMLLEILLGVGALAGGFALMLGPQGEILPIPVSLLKDSPFENYFLPGLILFTILGICPLLVSVLSWRNHRWAPILTLGVGIALLVWMMVEISIIGYSNTPPLQPIYIAFAALIIIVGFVWLRHHKNPCNP